MAETENRTGMVLLTVQQGHAFEAAVAAGKFATFEDAVNASRDALGLTQVGDELYSKEALAHLQTGMEQAARGETIPGEVVMAELDAWLKELDDKNQD